MAERKEVQSDKVCWKCGNIGDTAKLATCCQCKTAVEHIYCMWEQLFEVPQEWYCEECEGSPLLAQDEEPNASKRPKNFDGSFSKLEAAAAPTRILPLNYSAGSGRLLAEVKKQAGALKPLCSRDGSAKEPDNYNGSTAPVVCYPSSSQGMKPLSHGTSSKVIKPPRSELLAEKVGQSKSGVKSNTAGCFGATFHQKHQGNIRSPLISNNTSTNLSTPACPKAVQVLPQPKKGPLDSSVPSCPSKPIFAMQQVSNEKDEKIPQAKKRGTSSYSDSELKRTGLQATDLPQALVLHGHALQACWKGTFEVFDVVCHAYSAIQAHFPYAVSPKVYEITKHLPEKLKFKALPRKDAWPQIFQLDPPTKDDIGLYFLSCEVGRTKERYLRLLERLDSRDFALQTSFNGVQLFIYMSTQLPMASQRIDAEIYLWGAFRHMRHKKTSQHRQSQVSSATEGKSAAKSSVPVQNLEEVDMEIDMIGGKEIGRIDIPISRLDTPPGFPKPIPRDSSHVKSSIKVPVKVADPIDPDVPPGFSHIGPPGFPKLPNSKKQSSSLEASINRPLSFRINGRGNPSQSTREGYVAPARKAHEMQPNCQQVLDVGHKSADNLRSSCHVRSTEEKKSFNSSCSPARNVGLHHTGKSFPPSYANENVHILSGNPSREKRVMSNKDSFSPNPLQKGKEHDLFVKSAREGDKRKRDTDMHSMAMNLASISAKEKGASGLQRTGFNQIVSKEADVNEERETQNEVHRVQKSKVAFYVRHKSADNRRSSCHIRSTGEKKSFNSSCSPARNVGLHHTGKSFPPSYANENVHILSGNPSREKRVMSNKDSFSSNPLQKGKEHDLFVKSAKDGDKRKRDTDMHSMAMNLASVSAKEKGASELQRTGFNQIVSKEADVNEERETQNEVDRVQKSEVAFDVRHKSADNRRSSCHIRSTGEKKRFNSSCSPVRNVGLHHTGKSFPPSYANENVHILSVNPSHEKRVMSNKDSFSSNPSQKEREHDLFVKSAREGDKRKQDTDMHSTAMNLASVSAKEKGASELQRTGFNQIVSKEAEVNEEREAQNEVDGMQKSKVAVNCEVIPKEAKKRNELERRSTLDSGNRKVPSVSLGCIDSPHPNFAGAQEVMDGLQKGKKALSDENSLKDNIEGKEKMECLSKANRCFVRDFYKRPSGTPQLHTARVQERRVIVSEDFLLKEEKERIETVERSTELEADDKKISLVSPYDNPTSSPEPSTRVQEPKSTPSNSAPHEDMEGTKKLKSHRESDTENKQLCSISVSYDSSPSSPDQLPSAAQSGTNEAQASSDEWPSKGDKEGIERTETRREVNLENRPIYLSSENQNSPPSTLQATQSPLPTPILPLFPEVEETTRDHGLNHSMAAHDLESGISKSVPWVSPDLSLTRPLYLKDGNGWISNSARERLKKDGCGHELRLSLSQEEH